MFLPGVFSKKSTLRQIRRRAARFLSLTLHDGSSDHPDLKECNCALARAISEETLFKIDRLTRDHGDGNPFIFIHSRNNIEVEWAKSLDNGTVHATVKQCMQGMKIAGGHHNKTLTTFRGRLPIASER